MFAEMKNLEKGLEIFRKSITQIKYKEIDNKEKKIGGLIKEVQHSNNRSFRKNEQRKQRKGNYQITN